MQKIVPIAMHLNELDFNYPESLVAIKPAPNPRVMFVAGKEPQEISIDDLIQKINPGDLFIINESKVIKARITSECGMEILFLEPQSNNLTQKVMCLAKNWPIGKELVLPQGVKIVMSEKGIPQTVTLSKVLDLDYFEKFGEMPLPPYIKKARSQVIKKKDDNQNDFMNDEKDYQTVWAQKWGSLAAPTASLHFKEEHLKKIKSRGGEILKITLHVGLGTFLPIQTDNVLKHEMHSEFIEIEGAVIEKIKSAKKQNVKIWALGTTVARTLESLDLEFLKQEGNFFRGNTKIFITPGFNFRYVDVLLTNFHQPRSTLIALVGAFAGLEKVKSCYNWAIENNFRLFSYGDLSAWEK